MVKRENWGSFLLTFVLAMVTIIAANYPPSRPILRQGVYGQSINK